MDDFQLIYHPMGVVETQSTYDQTSGTFAFNSQNSANALELNNSTLWMDFSNSCDQQHKSHLLIRFARSSFSFYGPFDDGLSYNTHKHTKLCVPQIINMEFPSRFAFRVDSIGLKI